jgi:hypothetical protein
LCIGLSPGGCSLLLNTVEASKPNPLVSYLSPIQTQESKHLENWFAQIASDNDFRTQLGLVSTCFPIEKLPYDAHSGDRQVAPLGVVLLAMTERYIEHHERR